MLVLVYLLVTCQQMMHEICGGPSTDCSSGQPQCSAHGQRLREHYPRFPYCRIIQCWMTAVWDERWEDCESGTYPINSGMSRVYYLPQHRTLSTRYTLQLYVARDRQAAEFLLMKANFENSIYINASVREVKKRLVTGKLFLYLLHLFFLFGRSPLVLY